MLARLKFIGSLISTSDFEASFLLLRGYARFSDHLVEEIPMLRNIEEDWTRSLDPKCFAVCFSDYDPPVNVCSTNISRVYRAVIGLACVQSWHIYFNTCF